MLNLSRIQHCLIAIAIDVFDAGRMNTPLSRARYHNFAVADCIFATSLYAIVVE